MTALDRIAIAWYNFRLKHKPMKLKRKEQQ